MLGDDKHVTHPYGCLLPLPYPNLLPLIPTSTLPQPTLPKLSEGSYCQLHLLQLSCPGWPNCQLWGLEEETSSLCTVAS